MGGEVLNDENGKPMWICNTCRFDKSKHLIAAPTNITGIRLFLPIITGKS